MPLLPISRRDSSDSGYPDTPTSNASPSKTLLPIPSRRDSDAVTPSSNASPSKAMLPIASRRQSDPSTPGDATPARAMLPIPSRRQSEATPTDASPTKAMLPIPSRRQSDATPTDATPSKAMLPIPSRREAGSMTPTDATPKSFLPIPSRHQPDDLTPTSKAGSTPKSKGQSQASFLPISSRRQPDASPTNAYVKSLTPTSKGQPDASPKALLQAIPLGRRNSKDLDLSPIQEAKDLSPMPSYHNQFGLTHTPDKKYSIGRALGEGGHGTVHLSTEVATGEKVAIKVMSVQNIKEAAAECTTMGILTHPHIVPLHETIVDLDGKRIFLVMELCRGGDMFDMIAEVGQLDEASARNYFGQMASALVECHLNGVYHRDLKPENILLDEDGNVKIADFGLAMMAGKDMRRESRTLCGSVPYVAPEVLTAKEKDSVEYSADQVDVWSLGIVLFIMLTGRMPWKIAIAEDCPAYAGYLEHGLSHLKSAKGLSKEATDLLEGMLNPNPDLRLRMSETLASSWQTGEKKGSPRNPGKWCEVLGYFDIVKPKHDPLKFSSQESAMSTRVPTQALSMTSDSPPDSPTKTFGQRSSPMRDGDSANDMLVRMLGWINLPAPQEKLVESVTDVLEGLGVDYSVSQGELSHVVKVHSTCETGDDASSGPDSESPSTAASSDDNNLPAFRRQASYMAGQLSVQIEIAAPESAMTSDFHIKRHRGSVLRFHSFYHDMKNRLASLNGWDEEAGRYLRVAEAH